MNKEQIQNVVDNRLSKINERTEKIMTRYVLKYLEEEMYIESVENSVVELREEWSDAEHVIGYRLIINEKETDIVVWYADLNEWLVKKIIESGIEI